MSRPEPSGPPGIDEPTFAEPWQAQAFAMAIALHERGVFTWAEWAATLSQEIARAGDAAEGCGYHACWLAALERMVDERGIAGKQDVDALSEAWRRAARATDHGSPVLLENDPLR